MDPISAFSLAVNVITVVEVAVKTGKTLHELYKSTSGFTKETQELIQATGQFEKALASLDSAQNQLAAAQDPGIADATATASKQCGEAMQAIKAILKQCRCGKPSSTRDALKTWLKTNVKHRAKLEELQANLESATRQLKISLAIATRIDIARVTQLLDASDKTQAQLAAQLQAIGEELPKLGENSTLLETIKEAVTLSEDSFNAMNHAAILRALRPVTADKRFEEINDPVASTFSWILDEPESFSDVNSEASSTPEDSPKSRVSLELTDWLKAGSGVFHIVGKPGCGKSTLMKYLAAHRSSRHFLEQWASQSGKQLICSSFFFWKLGTDEQKTMRGLRRGILYDVLRGNPDVARLVFPEHWAPKRHASQLRAVPELDISGSQVTAAFDRLLGSAETIPRFKICLFIDGLDEFDEPAESLWAFSSKLQTWAECDNVKLCVSSREEAPILKAFSSAHRVILHTVTSSDVEVLVRSRLESNPHFQMLARSDPAGGASSSRFQSSIVENAEGVFLWVVLLLKWVEEELATGTGSFQALRRLVETAPQELDQFFMRILDSIPKHHSRGAYFIFAMMLRTRGYCISHECSQDIPTVDEGFRELSIFGLSYVFDAFERAKTRDGNRHTAFPTTPCADRSEYRNREHQAVSRLQSWCKGLAEVKESNCVRIAMFTHRSVPDFLSSALQDIARKWSIDDNWIAEGILTTCLAESKAQHITDRPSEDMITLRLSLAMQTIARTGYPVLGPSASRIFTLLDEIDTTRQGLRHGAPGGIGNVSLPSFYVSHGGQDCYLIHGTLCPLFAIATSAAVPLIGYIMWKLQDPQILADPINQLTMLAAFLQGAFSRHLQGAFSRHLECKFPDVSGILRAILASGLSPNLKYPQCQQREDGKFTFTKWLEYLASEQKDRVIYNKESRWRRSPWRDTLAMLLSVIAFSDKGTVSDSVWNELQVWLQYGAEVPADILVITIDDSTAGVGFRFPPEKAEVASCFTFHPAVYENFRKAAGMEYFQTFKSTTMSSMIMQHNPPNWETLLKYTDPAISLAEDPQEWKPPAFAGHNFAGPRSRHRLLGSNTHWEQYQPRRGFWKRDIVWRADLHAWVPESYESEGRCSRSSNEAEAT
ncbi:hypothetical protein QBC47DRAFT_314808 [Echria macrotheca]|uniref:NACHT domain-containing protein n=1 Tax=Echria macrotheca TaxID=438768 RepID=A0AAJ0BII8_9PEZI|nr:hypothetical protein QBC47DRAFT_314808 [Echria macrotheca]